MSQRSLAAWGLVLAVAVPLSTGLAMAGDSPAVTHYVDAQHAQLAGLAALWPKARPALVLQVVETM